MYIFINLYVLYAHNKVRTCDSCYNRLIYKQEMAKRQAVIDAMQAQHRHGPPSHALHPTVSGHGPVSSSLQQAKKDLFGASASASAPSPQDARSSSTQRPAAGVAATMSTMNEVQLKLQERGEKLSKLSDRTADMANQAQE